MIGCFQTIGVSMLFKFWVLFWSIIRCPWFILVYCHMHIVWMHGPSPQSSLLAMVSNIWDGRNSCQSSLASVQNPILWSSPGSRVQILYIHITHWWHDVEADCRQNELDTTCCRISLIPRHSKIHCFERLGTRPLSRLVLTNHYQMLWLTDVILIHRNV